MSAGYHPYEHLPVVDAIAPQAAAANMRRDFFLSYKFTQGNGRQHSNLLKLTAGAYSCMWSPERMAGVLDEALPLAVRSLEHFGPPKSHRSMKSDVVEKDRLRRWGDFADALYAQAATEEVMCPAAFFMRASSFRFMQTLRDMRFTARGRAGTPSGLDAHASHYREHVLQGVSTGSPVFDATFGVLRHIRITRSAAFWESSLRGAWEYYHPDEPFYSEAFLEALKAEGTMRVRISQKLPSMGAFILRQQMPALARTVARQRFKEQETTNQA